MAEIGGRLGSVARLAAVRRARDDSAGWRPIIDHVVELTAAATGLPVALASFITADRQAVLGATGVDGVAAGYELPLTVPLCGHVVAGDLPLIVADAVADERFTGSDAVRLHGIRGYAGFPVRDDDGSILAVAAHRPVDWSAAQLRCLDHAARVLAALMTGTHAADVAARTDAQRQRAFLHALLECLDTGVAACDEQGRLVLLNRALREFLPGGDGYQDSPSQEWADRVTHPDGRLFTAGEMPLERAMHGQTVRSDDQIIPDRRGRPRRYAVNATPITDRDGRRLGAVAAVHDVTDQRRAERFRRCELAVARSLPAAADLEGAGRAVLAAVGETLGWPYAELWLHDPLTDVMRPAAAWTRDGPGLPLPAHLPTGAGLAGVTATVRLPRDQPPNGL
ncbi:PAS domain-containing protein [Dactylosporangium sp. NPDC049742]|uniref:PAS domain-containing protein n=1 Tax=Dactylosporangium sp. NPDC049742 TaxID=3154737 RepID=UPI00343F19FA